MVDFGSPEGAETFVLCRSKARAQKEERVQAHILVCFLAYVLWKMLGQMCKRPGLGNEPRKVLDEISQIKALDVVMPTKSRQSITPLQGFCAKLGTPLEPRQRGLCPSGLPD